MRPWLVPGRRALDLVAGRADLWLPGALAHLVLPGWLVLLLVVVPMPSPGDLAFAGAGLAASGLWPWNAALLGAGAGAAVLAGLLLLAAAEVVLARAVSGRRSGALDAPRMLAAMLAATLPVAAALVALAAAAVSVAPAEFQAPDIGGGVLARILGRVAPLLVLLVAALLLAQAYGAAATRRVAVGGQDLTAALGGAAGDLVRRPLPIAGLALGSAAVSTAYAAIVLLLLRVIWAPIAARVAAGQLVDAIGTVLLVGFVAIWFCCLLGGGALHAWVSTWWTYELARGRPGRRPPDAVGEARGA